ncbi:hypothetical protein EV175_000878 [Coemansia sp. RSA 1933]|nr:hypothetical protein EV175_000878 [Coemansia sp. RSA 1933]
MDKQVRQFYAADGASFIEHVPGHCLVFIPNTTNIGYVARELRRIRPQRPRPKPRGSGSSKPTNAFIKYRNHKINELKEMYPDISQTEISRMAGRCWETEDESVKIEFRKQYLEDKRIYDMNKAKRQCLEGGIGFDSDGMLGSTSSTSSRGMLGSTPSTSGGDRNGPGKMPDLGFGSDGRPAGFNTGRRRSHTLPSGGFSHYSPKRRISQELRKHLANKNNTYYTAIAASTGVDSSFVPSNGYISSESSTSNSSMAVSSGANFLFGVPQQQLQQPRYDFTFAAPPADIAVASSSAQPPSSSSSSTIGMDLSSPYMGYNSSTMAMPLNPSFPIAEFSDAHGRVVSQNAQGYSLGQAAFPAVSQDALAPFMQSTDSIAKSLADSAIATSLPMINTNIMSFSNDRMAIDGFSAGYISADTPSLDATPYQLPELNAYSSVPSDHPQRQ